MKEEKYTCDICHEEHDVSELTYFDESYLCEDCLRRETFICRDCGDRQWNDGKCEKKSVKNNPSMIEYK